MITAVVILIAIIVIAAYLTHTLDKNDELPTELPYTKEELDNIKLAEELYNKDLRPIVAKKTKSAPELDVIEPEFVEKVFLDNAVLNQEEVKPVKKKRKYYPRKKK